MLLVAAIFIIGVIGPCLAFDGSSDVTFSQDNIRKEIRKKYEFDYTQYLKGEKKLGFNPTKALFQRIYYTISFKYINPVTNNEMSAGVIKEVKRLLKQAKVSAASLSKVPAKGIPMEEIVQLYGDKIPPELIRYACIRGMMDALDDPHSVFLLPDEYRRLTENMEGGNFTGIGVFITADPDNYNWLTVSEPIEGTPAYNAGLQPGDIIIAVDGKSTKGEYIDLSVKRIRGPEGSKVVLTIKRKGAAKPINIPIMRKFIHVSSTKDQMLKDNIGYVKIRQYGHETGEELEKSIQNLLNKGAKAIVVDVRNNPGGLINAAQDVCSKFLPSGSPIVATVNRSKQKRIMRSNGGSHYDIPMVLLVNELSASASEITAGALKDNGRATIIGTRTYGKGSVQELTPIYGGAEGPAALKMTVALFYTPKGTKINGQGLKPDINVPMEVRDATLQRINKDKQLQKAIQYLRGKTGSK